MFRVGQKVVCVATPWVGASAWDYWRSQTPNVPELQQVYTIRDFVFEGRADYGFRLNEILNPLGIFLSGQCEAAFLAMCFRPAVERKTDTGMAILKKLLQPKPERVE